MKKLFCCIFLLTIFDAAATTAGIRLGYLEEANPLVRRLAETTPLATGLAICLIAGLLLLLLYSLRHRTRWLGYAMTGVLIIKSVIVCIHLYIAFSALHEGYFAFFDQAICGLLFFIGIG